MAANITNVHFAKMVAWPKFEEKKTQNKNKNKKKQANKQKNQNTFPKEFSNEIWLKVGEHEYIYITEIKFEKYYPVSK